MSDGTYSIEDKPHYGYSKITRRWVEIELPASNLGEWLRDYQSVEIAIADVLDTSYIFNPHLYTELTYWPDDLASWFLSQEGRVLSVLTPGSPSLTKATVIVQPLHYHPVDTVVCPPNTHPTQDFSVDDADDLVLGYSGETLDTATNDCLYSVGGLWVPHQREPYGVRLAGAGSIIRHGGFVGGTVVNFNGIGKVTTYQMSTLQVLKVDTTLSYRSTLTIQTPENLYGKSLLLVIAGKMHIIPSASIISDNVFCISTANWNIAEHILNTSDRIDWSYLGMDDPSKISVSKLFNDVTFEEYLNHPLSFLVVIDNPYLEYDYGAIDICRRTGVYVYTGEDAPGILLTHTNDIIDYWPDHDEGMWGLYTDYVQSPKYAMFDGKYRKQTNFTNTPNHLKSFSAPNLRMLTITAKI